MRRRIGEILALGFSFCVVGAAAFAQGTTSPTAGRQQTPLVAEAPLTNADVVKLCKLDLGDEVVIAKIGQATVVEFKLDTDSLAALKQENVSKGVIAAMLKRVTPAQQVAAPGAPPSRATVGPSIVLKTSYGDSSLSKMGGSVDYRLGGTRTYHEFGGAQSRTRTHDKNPSILLSSDGDPRGQYFLVSCDSSTKKNKRSVRIGGGLLGMRGATAPNEDNIVEYEATPDQAGLWRLTPTKPLKPGEYGLFVTNSNVLSAGDLYDFGVD